MKRVVRYMRRALGGFAKRQDGSATIEFAIWTPLFITLLFAAAETGMMTAKQVALDRGVDMTVRDLRLGKYKDPDADDLRESVCFYAGVIIPNCEAETMVELRTVSDADWGTLDPDATCVEYQDEEIVVQEDPVYSGVENTLMLVRVCSMVDTIFPSTKFTTNLGLNHLNQTALVSATAFVNEPS
ncbi:TadE/TadG family type IV pilus assembly protein [Pseudoruegeria sp. SHC-113]|uniref:TadE/TadG family type IV pilus assembly protein n=1 Tax=Pseudoruegeria sp. SHC-113 TaxID=2855439 RepID=UPI0021BA4D58|nr:TadE/TadG family type IV pilus assembly protein [Pseudoruegeria sp. SHC-113]MCT8159153.1 pilus assembly protein [Pseudoruegeria sp. SHC-113]